MLTLVVALAGAVTATLLAVAGRRTAAADRSRGLRRARGWRIPARFRFSIGSALRDADVDLEPEQAVELWAIATVAAGVLAVAFAPGLVVFALAGAFVAAPVGLRLARSRRERCFVAALPGALEQVAAELRGGGTVGGAIERLAVGDVAVASDLRRVVSRTRLGLPLVDALAAWPTEHDAAGVRAAAGALAVATTIGGRSAEAIDGLAASLRHRLDAVAEARALSAQARLSAVVVGAAPLGYLAFSSLVDPRSVSALLGSGVGRVCLVVGLALEGLAALWIRRIVASEV